jgi:hypothetical protein
MSAQPQGGYPNCTAATCQRPIARNLAYFNGQPYHFGCLKNTVQFGRAVAICRGCFSWLTEDKVTQLNFPEGETRTQRACALCGSQDLRFRRIPTAKLSEGAAP